MFGDINSIDVQAVNQVFFNNLNSAEGIEKIASVTGNFIHMKLREEGFARRIIPPVPVTPEDCTRSTEHDGLVKIYDIEPNSAAFAVNFNSRAPTRYIQGKRYAVPFQKIETEPFVKNEMELLSSQYPICQLIQENSLKDIQEAEDQVFLSYAQAATEVTGKQIINTTDKAVNRTNINQLFKLIDGDRLQNFINLMTNVDWDDWLIQPATEIGSTLASEITTNGYKFDKILDRRVIVTNKTNLLKPGEFFGFTAPNYLGNFNTLGQARFDIKKTKDVIEWCVWHHIGLGIGNIRACSYMKLKSVEESA